VKRGIDLLGKRVGKLVVTAELVHPVGVMAHRLWIAVCDCGNYTKVRSGALRHRVKPIRSCGCLIAETHRIRPYESLYNRLRRIAKKQKHKCALGFKQFVDFTKTTNCHYCHAPVEWVKYSIGATKGAGGYKIDRKDNTKGYSKENCVVCCSSCNRTKGDRFTYEQFVQIGKVIRSFREP